MICFTMALFTRYIGNDAENKLPNSRRGEATSLADVRLASAAISAGVEMDFSLFINGSHHSKQCRAVLAISWL
jgi:hypothetical protein